MSENLHLVTLCGSLRAASYNRALVQALPELAPATLKFEELEWGHLPIYNGDLEQDGMPPKIVRELQERIRASDGVIIATPEYNHSVPGGLKNALDWLSRGPAPHGFFQVPTAILGASDGTIGTTRAQAILRQILATLNAPTMPSPQVLVANANTRIDEHGVLTHESTRSFIATWLVEVERWMRRFPRSERS